MLRSFFSSKVRGPSSKIVVVSVDGIFTFPQGVVSDLKCPETVFSNPPA